LVRKQSGSGDVAQIDILAQAISEEAAFRLKDMLKMS
jgi:hypothetical protein